MRPTALLLALAACGRIDFAAPLDAPPPDSGPFRRCASFGPFEAPVHIAALASANTDDVAPVLTPDNQQVYYGHESGEILVADRIGELAFSAPRVLDDLGTGGPLAMSLDGLSLWLVSDRGGSSHVYRATRASLADDFANPTLDDSILPAAYSFTIDATHQLAFLSDGFTMYQASYPFPAGPIGALQEVSELETAGYLQDDLNVTPDGRAFWASGPDDPDAAPSIYTADLDAATRTFSNRRRWELSEDGIGEHGVRSTLDGTELWLTLHEEPAVGGSDLFVSRRACL